MAQEFSIVTPSFQQLEWLRLAMASVADQEGVQVEHIIQDAGTAGVETTLDQWGASLGHTRYRAKLFVEEDDGMYDAVNRGLTKSHGEICGYLNCDEQYLPGTLAKVAKIFTARPEIDVLFGDIILVDQEGQPLSYRRTVLPTRAHVRLAHLNTPSSATFFRRRLLARGFYFDPNWKTIGDAVWVENLLEKKVRMTTLSEPLAVFAFTGNNLGATSLSRAEAQKWRSSRHMGMKFRSIAVFWQRIRKALAGAYRRRRVEINIFTLKSPEKRQRRVAESVGFAWPTSLILD
jgi:glycosyltransferase involved in cell wall biosynthesis